MKQNCSVFEKTAFPSSRLAIAAESNQIESHHATDLRTCSVCCPSDACHRSREKNSRNQRKESDSMKSQRVDTWAASIPDRAGALAAKLNALSAGDVNLEFVVARRSAEKKGTGVVFVTPIKGAKQIG